MNFVLCADSQFLPYTEVVVSSLLRVYPSTRFRVHLYVPRQEAAGEAVGRIRRRVDRHSGNMAVRGIDLATLDAVKLPPQLSSGALMRILVPRHIGHDISRFVYLDSDLVVLGRLDDLFTLNLEGNSFGAALEYGFATPALMREWDVWDYFNELGISTEPLSYFNSGVLVVDPAEWNRRRTTERLLDWLGNTEVVLRHGDQDALNACTRGEWMEIHPRFNCGQHTRKIIRKQSSALPELAPRRAVLREALADPVVFHYVGRKPWHPEYLAQETWDRHTLAWWREARRSGLRALSPHGSLEVVDFMVRSACYASGVSTLIKLYWYLRKRLVHLTKKSM